MLPRPYTEPSHICDPTDTDSSGDVLPGHCRKPRLRPRSSEPVQDMNTTRSSEDVAQPTHLSRHSKDARCRKMQKEKAESL